MLTVTPRQIILNADGYKPNERIIIKQGCINTIPYEAVINDRGGILTIPSGVTAKIRMLKPDKNQVLNDLPNPANNKISFGITEQMQAYPGMGKAELILLDGENILTTVTFDIEIQPNVHDDSQLESAPEYTTILNTLARVEDAEAGLNGKLDKSALINDDVTGGADKVASAQVVKVHGEEIDAINTSLTNKAASITYNTTYASASISVFYNKIAKRISISNMTPLATLPAYTYTTLATINDVDARPSSTFIKVVTLDLNGATGYFKVEPNGNISVYPKVAISTAIYINEVIL